MDDVRRLTNFSTGRLGSELANFLAARGHAVTLLFGQQATWRGKLSVERVETFTTTANLHDRLRLLASQPADAVFHAAAVSDFGFGKVWQRAPDGALTELKAGKLSTREGTLLAELVPTPKIIAALRGWFPSALLVGWKYEVDGDQASVLAAARKQIADCRTDVCIANGPAYGVGFGLVNNSTGCAACKDKDSLFEALERLLRGRDSGGGGTR